MLLLSLGLALGLALGFASAMPAHADDPVRIEYFWAEGCPYCELQSGFLDDLEDRFGETVEVARFEVSTDPAARDRWVDELAARGRQASGVPTTIMGDRVWVGFDTSIGERILAAVQQEIAARDEDVTEPVPGRPDPPEPVVEDERIVVPIVGELALTDRSPIAATALIALVDGFNPCSLWVLTVLLAMVLNAGATRGRVAIVGTVFLLVTGTIYGAFIAGAYTVLGFLEHLGAIRTLVAAIALTVGAINVKDYFAYKRGVSLTIPDRFKPRIYRGGREIRDPGRSLPAVLATTVALAAGIALVELPCTAGFPVIWTGMMRSQGIGGAEFGGLLGLYLLVYVGLELLLFAVALITLSVASFQERHGRLLKLVGGGVMLALGVILLVAPTLMEDVGGVLLVVLGSIALAVIVDQVYRRVGGKDRDRERHPIG